jgi:drug/metabolite transporter (DMT)-like permease
MSTKTKGYMLGAIAAATYGMNPLFTLPLYQDGMDPYSVLFFRYLFSIPILGIMIVSRGRNFRIQRKELGATAIMGILAALSSLMLFVSYKYMAAGIASSILFVYPIMVALIMAIGFKEKLTIQTILCTVLALLGISLLYKSEDGGAPLNMTGMALVMGSALSYAIYIVGVNRPILRNVATVKLTFYVISFGLLVFIVGTRFCTDLMVPFRWQHWVNLFALALFPTAISFLCTTIAAQYIGSTPTAILGALEPVTAVFFGVTLFNETMNGRIALGILLILLAVTMVIAGGKITTQMVRFRKLFPRIIKHK